MEWNYTTVVLHGTIIISPTVTVELLPLSESPSDGYDHHLQQLPVRSGVDGSLLMTSFHWNSSTDVAVPRLNETTESQLQSLEEQIGSICLGMLLFGLCLITFIGNAMVLHAVRMEPRLQTVSFSSSASLYRYRH